MTETISSHEVSSPNPESEILPFPPFPPSEFIVGLGDFTVLNHHIVWDDDRFKGKEMKDVAWEYLRCTKRLIEEINEGNFDAVMYLDKSARPVSWFVRTFWQEMSKKNDQNEPLKQPMIGFLNVNGQDEIWKKTESEEKNEDPSQQKYDFYNINLSEDENKKNLKKYKEKVLAIRAIFSRGALSENNWMEEVMKDSDLDGKRILIVDEVKATGRTLNITKQLIEAAFPDSLIGGVYFWDSDFTIDDDKSQMHSVPAWFSKKDMGGRGVGDVDEVYYNEKTSDNKYKISDNRYRIGSFILSSPFYKDKIKIKTMVENGIIDKAVEPVGRERVPDIWAAHLRRDIRILHKAYSQCLKNNQEFNKR